MRPLLASLAVIVTGGLVLWQATDGLGALTAEGARRLAAVRDTPAVPTFAIETMTGAHRSLPPGDGRAAVVAFIYTTCPSICQAAGAELALLRDRLASGPLAGRVQLVSVSFDPAHDTPQRMAEYGGWYGADGPVWTVARPQAGDLAELLDAYGVTVIGDGAGGFTHNAALHLVSPEGRLVAILDTDDIEGAEEALGKVLR